MQRDNIIGVPFAPEQLEAAKKWDKALCAVSNGKKTKNFSDDNRIKGYLGHWGIEQVFRQSPYDNWESYLDVINPTGGDECDIKVWKGSEVHLIDCKGQGGSPGKYFFNEGLELNQDQHQSEKMTHYAFAKVDYENWLVHVYGICDWHTFNEYKEEREKYTKYYIIRAFRLTPLRGYIYN